MGKKKSKKFRILEDQCVWINPETGVSEDDPSRWNLHDSIFRVRYGDVLLTQDEYNHFKRLNADKLYKLSQ